MGELGDRSSCTTLCEQWPNVQPDACVGNGLHPNLSLSVRELKVWEHQNVWVGERRRQRDNDHRMGTMAKSTLQSQRSYHYPHGRDGCTDSWHWVGYRSLNSHTECPWCIVWWRVFPSAPLRSCMQADSRWQTICQRNGNKPKNNLHDHEPREYRRLNPVVKCMDSGVWAPALPFLVVWLCTN